MNSSALYPETTSGLVRSHDRVCAVHIPGTAPRLWSESEGMAFLSPVLMNGAMGTVVHVEDISYQVETKQKKKERA